MCKEILDTCSVQTKQTDANCKSSMRSVQRGCASNRIQQDAACAQVWWRRCQMSSWQGLRTSGAISQFGFLWNHHQIQTASTATDSHSEVGIFMYLQHSSTGFMTSWICSGSFKVFNSHPMIANDPSFPPRSAKGSWPMILSRSVVSCAAHAKMHPASKTLKKLRCIALKRSWMPVVLGNHLISFDLLVHVPIGLQWPCSAIPSKFLGCCEQGKPRK